NGATVNTSACNAGQSGQIACSFTVPNMAPGNYTLNFSTAALPALASAPFSVVPLLTPGSVNAAAGSNVNLHVSGLSTLDTGLSLWLNDTVLTPTGCSNGFQLPTRTITCSFVVPSGLRQ